MVGWTEQSPSRAEHIGGQTGPDAGFFLGHRTSEHVRQGERRIVALGQLVPVPSSNCRNEAGAFVEKELETDVVDLLEEDLPGREARLVYGDPDSPGVGVNARTAADHQVPALTPGPRIPCGPPRLNRDIWGGDGRRIVEDHHDVIDEPIHSLHPLKHGDKRLGIGRWADDRHTGTLGHLLQSGGFLLPGRPDFIEFRHALHVIANRVSKGFFEFSGIGCPCLRLAGVTADALVFAFHHKLGTPVVFGLGTMVRQNLCRQFWIVSLNLSP